jgi:hypothetical protein
VVSGFWPRSAKGFPNGWDVVLTSFVVAPFTARAERERGGKRASSRGDTAGKSVVVVAENPCFGSFFRLRLLLLFSCFKLRELMQFLPFKREIDELLICVGFCSPLELQALLVDNL